MAQPLDKTAPETDTPTPAPAPEPVAAPAPVLAVPEPRSLLEINAARTRRP